MKTEIGLSGLLIAGMLVSGSAQATLLDRGGGLIYDTDLNVTWLQDMNFAKTSGYSADGLMYWDEANAWAQNLVYGGFSDWRLPTILLDDPTCGSIPLPFEDTLKDFNCRGSEMGHLYYVELGGKRYLGVDNFSYFINKPEIYWAWSGTISSEIPYSTWFFGFGYGNQSPVNFYENPLYAMVVRSGDVIEESGHVPEPGSLALFGLAIGGLAVSRRKHVKDN